MNIFLVFTSGPWASCVETVNFVHMWSQIRIYIYKSSSRKTQLCVWISWVYFGGCFVGSSDLWPIGEMLSPPPPRTTDASRQILWRTTMSEWCQWRRSLYNSSQSQPWWVLLVLCASTHHLSFLSPLLVELWTIAERLRERRPRLWVLHHRSFGTNIHRPLAGEFSAFVLEQRNF